MQRQSVRARCVKSRQTPVRSPDISPRPCGLPALADNRNERAGWRSRRSPELAANRRHLVEEGGSHVGKFAVDLAIAAGEQELQNFVGQIADFVLRSVPALRVRLAVVLDNCVVAEHQAACWSEQTATPVAKRIDVLGNGNVGLDLERARALE